MFKVAGGVFGHSSPCFFVMKNRTGKIIGVIVGISVLALVSILLFKKKKTMKPFVYNESAGTSTKTKNWIDWISPAAKDIGKKYGLPYQALVVQTALETGWGKSSLAAKYFNFAGIKAVGSQPYVRMQTYEYENGKKVTKDANFRKFNSLEEGLDQYAQFFHKNKRYAQALKYPNDPY